MSQSSFLFGVLLLIAMACSSREAEILPADRVLVSKSRRELYLLKEGQVIKTYAIALGANPVGHKQQEGDEKTPEGIYRLDWRNAKSTCYKSIHISYPNEKDKEAARQLGISPGGDIMIHGLPNGQGWIGRLHTLMDWTDGCIGVTNPEMDEIWQAVKNGTEIEIRQ